MDTGAEHQQAQAGCPTREVLDALSLGKLPTDAIEIVGRHIETCPACQSVLEELDGLEDSMIADLKAYSGPLPADHELEE